MVKILLPLKQFQETLHSGVCGPASLKIILAYYGIEKMESELAESCNIDNNLGVSAEDICRIAHDLGLHTIIKNKSSFDDIEEWLMKDIPVIVDWFTRGRCDYDDGAVADGHYSVVMGLDDTFIYLQDPEIGSMRKITKEDFMTVWFDFSGKIIKSDELIIRQMIVIQK